MTSDAPSAALTVGNSDKAPRISGVLVVDFQVEGIGADGSGVRLKVDIRNGNGGLCGRSRIVSQT